MIDATTAVGLIEQAVAEKGADYICERPDDICVYVKDGEPSCLIGRALMASGLFSLEEVAALDGDITRDVLSVPAYGLLSRFPRRISAEAVDIFNWAQLEQDSGRSWGNVLKNVRQQAQAQRRVAASV